MVRSFHLHLLSKGSHKTCFNHRLVAAAARAWHRTTCTPEWSYFFATRGSPLSGQATCISHNTGRRRITQQPHSPLDVTVGSLPIFSQASITALLRRSARAEKRRLWKKMQEFASPDTCVSRRGRRPAEAIGGRVRDRSGPVHKTIPHGRTPIRRPRDMFAVCERRAARPNREFAGRTHRSAHAPPPRCQPCCRRIIMAEATATNEPEQLREFLSSSSSCSVASNR